MEDGKFLEFIYFSLFTISVNFPDQFITYMSEPVLKSLALSGNGVNDDSHFSTQDGRSP